MTHTIRIQDIAYQKLARLAKNQHLTLQAALSRSIESYEQKLFLEGLVNDFAKYKASSKDWQQEEKERDLWEHTLWDGEK